MKRPMLTAALYATLTLTVSADDAAEPATDLACDNKPVFMVVAGLTHDRAIMQSYAKAIAESGLYGQLAGYYVNSPLPIAVFEGDVPKNFATLIVRFPCLAHARAFWYSDVYQTKIKPLRTETNAGDYTVTVYPEIPVAPHMEDRVKDGGYTVQFGSEVTDSIPQVEGH